VSSGTLSISVSCRRSCAFFAGWQLKPKTGRIRVP